MAFSVEYPRDVAFGGATGVALWLGSNAFKKIAPKIGFGAIGLGAAANAVSMAVGLPVLAGYGISYAIDGKKGVDNFEFFLTHPSSWLQLSVQSVVAIEEHYDILNTETEFGESSKRDSFAGFRERQKQAEMFPMMA